MEIVGALSCLALSFIIFTIFSISTQSPKRQSQLPPGPKPYPLIGNILDIGKNFLRSFDKLSQTYGPIISLRIGNKLLVVISSPEMAREIITKNPERILPNLPPEIASTVQDHHKYSLVYRPMDKGWQNLRRICKEHMFSTRSLDASQHLRQAMMTRLCDYVIKCSVEGRAVDVGGAAFVTVLNLISASLFSTAVISYESGVAHEFRESVEAVAKVISSDNIADHIPILKPFDPQGIKKLADLHYGKLFSTIDGFINRRLEERRACTIEVGGAKNKYDDMLEVLIDIMETSGAKEFTCKDIKHLLMDLYVGSTSTTSAAVEWTMTELLRNPNIMSRVQDEVRTIFAVGTNAEESSKFPPYLNAVVKETFRHHPPAALFARISERDIRVDGGRYAIPKGTRLFINTYTICRDPNVWSDPEKFCPERFMGAESNNNKDYKGLDFEFLPFGSGKRICPGLPLADRIVHNMVATLVRKFDWKLEPGMQPEDLDMEEKSMAVLQKKVPLMAIPVSYY